MSSRPSTASTYTARDPDLCCHINKVEPLRAALAGARGWLNGRRRDKAATRSGNPVVERFEGGHPQGESDGGVEREGHLRLHAAALHPEHPLFDKGYARIGCAPCTRPVLAGEDERAGRWAGRGKTECGIHTLLKPA